MDAWRERQGGTSPSERLGVSAAVTWAVIDLLVRGDEFDLIVVSTLPAGLSRWLRQDLLRRIHRATGVAVRAVNAPRQATVDG